MMGNIVHLVTHGSALMEGTIVHVEAPEWEFMKGKPLAMTPALRQIADTDDKLRLLMTRYEPLYHSTTYPHDEYGWIVPVFGTEVRIFEDERAFTMMLDEEWV